MNKLIIKGPRQQRALEVLLKECIAVKDIGTKIGALNPRQVIFELRCQGFEGVILTRWFNVIDRDGRRCRPGEYYIPDSFKQMVEGALKNKITQTARKCSNQSLSSDAAMLTGGTWKCKT